ncbi:nucleotidyl transferase AbiEii/AbiGii toxin family protein [Colwellia sp. MSW7]|uniref:Nucleotidyl transferase AbiEii/AbiGii toxin family protein n=1 Tax=Colwellia maritima TaxID=2912588 RepID=A0ABS9X5G9_9GAMM|nr:nucleotidyl transferase AbiEii/AbiGii toxin family protein [Colwellia maritima]MCI2285487.1 nucleotidyl transferase AbiEii/AbiGii toxin family protein [Colwellia maritima]
MLIDSSLFLDVSDALGMGNPAIVEKDYYVIVLLKLLSGLSSETHSLVFTGGTALAKSGIKTHRMSEDVARYGNQHVEFVQSPIAELMFGLNVLEENKIYEERFQQYVVPMVYGDIIITWQNAFSVFKSFAKLVLNNKSMS